MPKVTIWIRNKDLNKWNDIADIPTWLHEKLKTVLVQSTKEKDGLGSLVDDGVQINTYDQLVKTTYEAKNRKKVVLKTKEDAEEIVPLLVPPVAKNIPRDSSGLCKVHGTPLTQLGKCLQKGCKYS